MLSVSEMDRIVSLEKGDDMCQACVVCQACYMCLSHPHGASVGWYECPVRDERAEADRVRDQPRLTPLGPGGTVT